ncbi:MAG TPA: M50 family metallopeptidase [Rhizomicrobium sp.]|jgi:Zn-dependent protease
MRPAGEKAMRVLATIVLLIPNIYIFGGANAIYDGSGDGAVAFAFVLAVCEFFLATLAHEAGHAVAATYFGWQVELFAVTPIAWRRKTRRFEFWLKMGADFGGAVYCRSGNDRRKLALLHLAGPLANFALTLVLAILFVAAALILRPYSAVPGALMISLAGVSFFMGIGNLIPFRARNGNRSDGANLAMLLRRRPRYP